MPSITQHRLESDLEDFFYRKVRKVGGMVLKIAPTQAGAPDRLVLLPGGSINLVELKTETGTVRDIQRVWHERASTLGVAVYVLRGRGEVMSWLRTQFLREVDGEAV